MKNYWIEQYRKKNAKFWTAEFSRNGHFVLRPRKVGVYFYKKHCKITFFDSMQSIHDHELIDFITESKQRSMLDMYARMRSYQGLVDSKEIENYEFTHLKYFDIGVGSRPEDIKFEFSFKNSNHVVL